jgi:UDPglucose 6-dehydrogenase
VTASTKESPTNAQGRPPADIAVIGCGYVGLVTAVGLAEQGYRVRAYDIDPARIAACRALRFPMLEPGLEEAARAAGDGLTFHDVRSEPWTPADFTFLAVPTPQGVAGYPNLSMLEGALGWIAESPTPATESNVIVIRSTVPPGTARWAAGVVKGSIGIDVPVVANPEFLQEGRALADFRSPSRILIGSDDAAAASALRDLMAFTSAEVIVTDSSTAELAKYGSNAFLAVRVSFANEIARLAEREGADALLTLKAIGLDPRIGSRYLLPGVGYGGSCLPKDVAALVALGEEVGAPMRVLDAVAEVNAEQPRRLVELTRERLGPLSGRRLTVLGLAFKPDTDDVRHSPAFPVLRDLLAEDAAVTVHDPVVGPEALAELGAAGDAVVHTHDLVEALRGADAVLPVRRWATYATVPELLADAVPAPLVVDGRRVLAPDSVAAYTGIGR